VLTPKPLHGPVGHAENWFLTVTRDRAIWQRALALSENAARVSNVAFATPFLALLPIAVVLGEPIAPSTLPGLCLILGGLAVQQRFARAARA
jgi:drug/metabolite transporter (DMT)-like permease